MGRRRLTPALHGGEGAPVGRDRNVHVVCRPDHAGENVEVRRVAPCGQIKRIPCANDRGRASACQSAVLVVLVLVLDILRLLQGGEALGARLVAVNARGSLLWVEEAGSHGEVRRAKVCRGAVHGGPVRGRRGREHELLLVVGMMLVVCRKVGPPHDLGDRGVGLLAPDVGVDAAVPLGRFLLPRRGARLLLLAPGRLVACRAMVAVAPELLLDPRLFLLVAAVLLPLPSSRASFERCLQLLNNGHGGGGRAALLPPLGHDVLVVRLLVLLHCDARGKRVLAQLLWRHVCQVAQLRLVVLNVVVGHRMLAFQSNRRAVVRHGRLLGLVEGAQVRVLALLDAADAGLPPPRVRTVAHAPEPRLAAGEAVALAPQMRQKLLLCHLPDFRRLGLVLREGEVQGARVLVQKDGRLVVGAGGLLLGGEGAQVDLLFVFPDVGLPPARDSVLGHAAVDAGAFEDLGAAAAAMAAAGLAARRLLLPPAARRGGHWRLLLRGRPCRRRGGWVSGGGRRGGAGRLCVKRAADLVFHGRVPHEHPPAELLARRGRGAPSDDRGGLLRSTHRQKEGTKKGARARAERR
mmetsp:Transcript_1600/g.3615  ORF Transcript_1600/g.3615 Transcript_1600/m.3615 type:complete len:577 (-) Transcript_1600:471-2201(-)